MTPKEKAKELINKFIKPTIKWNAINGVDYYNDINTAKKCALIAVDEILSDYKNYLMHENTEYKGLMYWQEVKQEIEAL